MSLNHIIKQKTIELKVSFITSEADRDQWCSVCYILMMNNMILWCEYVWEEIIIYREIFWSVSLWYN